MKSARLVHILWFVPPSRRSRLSAAVHPVPDMNGTGGHGIGRMNGRRIDWHGRRADRHGRQERRNGRSIRTQRVARPPGTGGSAPGTGGSVDTGGSGSSGSIGTGGSSRSTGGPGVTAGMSTGCGKAPGIASSSYSNGKPISSRLPTWPPVHPQPPIPTSYDNMHPYKLVIAFHQRDRNDAKMYSQGYYGYEPRHDNPDDLRGAQRPVERRACSRTSNGEDELWLAQPEQLGLRARRRRRGAGRGELLRRHQPDLRDGVELRRRDVLRDLLRPAPRWRVDGLRPRDRRLFRITFDHGRPLSAHQTGRLLRVARNPGQRLALQRGRHHGAELRQGQWLHLGHADDGDQR